MLPHRTTSRREVFDTDVSLSRSVLAEGLERARNRRSVVEDAIKIQRGEVQRLEYEASKLVCEKVRESYRERVQGVAYALIGFGAAVVKLQILQEQFRDQGIHWMSYLPVTMALVGDPRDRNSRIAQWFLDAEQSGAVPPGTSPREWKEKWK